MRGRRAPHTAVVDACLLGKELLRSEIGMQHKHANPSAAKGIAYKLRFRAKCQVPTFPSLRVAKGA